MYVCNVRNTCNVCLYVCMYVNSVWYVSELHLSVFHSTHSVIILLD